MNNVNARRRRSQLKFLVTFIGKGDNRHSLANSLLLSREEKYTIQFEIDPLAISSALFSTQRRRERPERDGEALMCGSFGILETRITLYTLYTRVCKGDSCSGNSGRYCQNFNCLVRGKLCLGMIIKKRRRPFSQSNSAKESPSTKPALHKASSRPWRTPSVTHIFR